MRFLANALQFGCILAVFVAAGSVVPGNVFQYYTWIAQIFLCFSVSMWILEIIQDFFFTAKVDTKNKAVLITGCDTGFGNAIARILDDRGYKVFACCLNKASKGASELKEMCSENLSVIQMDVTNDASVDSAVKSVENHLGKSELWAIINNAGVLKGFQTELSTMKDYEMCIQVNTLGIIRTTKAFLPLLRKSRGRVVNVCSLAGRFRCSFMGAYMTSKSAAVAFSEVLRQEMREFGVRVISIEPEFFGTQMCSEEYVINFLKEACSEVDEEVKCAYGKDYIEKAQKVYWGIFSRHSPDVKRVYDAIEAAVSLENPADIYRPMRNIFFKMTFMLAERVPVVFNEQFIILLFLMMGLPTPKTGVNVIARFFKM